MRGERQHRGSRNQRRADALTMAGAQRVAFRDTKLINESWANKTPLPWRIPYMLAGPEGRPPAKVAVARKVAM